MFLSKWLSDYYSLKKSGLACLNIIQSKYLKQMIYSHNSKNSLSSDVGLPNCFQFNLFTKFKIKYINQQIRSWVVCLIHWRHINIGNKGSHSPLPFLCFRSREKKEHHLSKVIIYFNTKHYSSSCLPSKL